MKRLAQIEEVVWYVFLATLAWQTRVILWQADLQFIEWRSMAIYASDVLMLMLFGLAVARGWLKGKIFRRSDWLLGALLASAILSLCSALSITVGLYGVLRLAQFILLFIYLRSWAFKRFDAAASVAAFLIGAFVQSVLALAQYLLQHDVGIRWMGETLLRTDMHGVAVFYDLAHNKILRAYGTLPHPNVLAAYLMMAFWALIWLYQRHVKAGHKWLWAVCGAILILAMEVTFSRTMLAAWVAATALLFCLAWFSKNKRYADLRQPLLEAIILSVAVSALFVIWQWPRLAARMTISVEEEAVQLRLRYNSDALRSNSGFLGRVNWTGIGIGNFSTWLAKNDPGLPAYLRQPAHNLFLLVYSELGVLGLLVWLVWLGLLIVALWNQRSTDDLAIPLLIILGAFLFIALFDHFFWTLQQGRLLWWGLLALIYKRLTK